MPNARLVFAVASALAVGAGAVALAIGGAPVSAWIRNPLAWVVGALAALGIAKLGQPRQASALIGIGLLVLVATFAARPVDGVHRWIDIGPLHIHAAALALPVLLVSLARLNHWLVQLALVGLAGVLLVLQPDASQASAFAASSAVLLYRRAESPAGGLAAAGICAVIIIASWLRPDPLEPVPEVEGILAMAAQASLLLAVIAAAALALTCLAPLVHARSGRANDGPIALAVYCAIVALAPAVGAFPVPLVGLGMSFPLGWWLGFVLATKAQRSDEADN